MSNLNFKTEPYYTYSDYLEWDTDIRYEMLNGVPYMMAAPSRAHQAVLGELHRQLANFLRGKPCAVFVAPFDVRLNAFTRDDTVFHPDLLIVCDRKKLDDKSCKGAPDMVIEIISPSTKIYDCDLKLKTYLQSGVRECWLVDPDKRTVTVYFNDYGQIKPEDYNGGVIPVKILEGFGIDIDEVFAEI